MSETITTNFIDSNIDVGKKYITKSYLMDLYPYLDANNVIGISAPVSSGNNEFGQLGLNDTTDRSTPVQVVSAGLGWKQVSCGKTHILAVKTDGSLWGSGNNQFGQIGQNNTLNKSSPTQVGTNYSWFDSACGENFSIAIQNIGTLWSWGLNSSGQLGLNDLVNRSTPIQVGTATDWKQVSCGIDYAAAIKANGTIFTWGSGGFGKLGLNDTASRSTPTQVGSETNWKQVSTGAFHTASIKTNGTLYTWGYNDQYGALGLNDLVNRSTPTQVGSENNWKQVSCGYFHTIAIKTDGSIWAWGLNASGQLGLNDDTNHRSTPVQIGAGTNWKQVFAGANHTVAIKTDGTLWTWGDNNNGGLMINSTTHKSTPTQVTGIGENNWRRTPSNGCGGSNYTIAIQEVGDDF